MVTPELVPYGVVARLAQLWKNVLPRQKMDDEFPVTGKMDSGWAVLKDSPQPTWA